MSDGPKEGRLIKSDYINGYKETINVLRTYVHTYAKWLMSKNGAEMLKEIIFTI